MRFTVGTTGLVAASVLIIKNNFFCNGGGLFSSDILDKTQPTCKSKHLSAMNALEQITTEAMRWYNLPFTVLLGLLLAYWALKILLGLFGAAFDFDLDADVDPESVEEGFFSRASQSLSDGEAPFTVALTFFAFSTWGLMMVLNHFLNPASVWAIGLAIMAAGAAAALFVTRLLLRFAARQMRRMIGMTPQHESFIGAIGEIVTGEVTESFGQIEIQHDGAPCRLNVDLAPGSEPLTKGHRARIVSVGREGKTYLVVKADGPPPLSSTTH